MVYDLKKEGKTHVISGFGKYKSSAAFGTVLRGINQNWKILIVQFLKGQKSGEIQIFEDYFSENVTILRYGVDKIVLPDNATELDRTETQRGWAEMLNELKRGKEVNKIRVINGNSVYEGIKSYDLLVLDEVLPAVDLKLLTQKQLFDLLEDRPVGLEIICTGRVTNRSFMDNLTNKSNLHSDIVCKRHYFSCKCPS